MTKKSTSASATKFETMDPDLGMRQRLMEHLSSGPRLLADGSPFAELLQEAVNSMLSGEVNHHLEVDLGSEAS